MAAKKVTPTVRVVRREDGAITSLHRLALAFREVGAAVRGAKELDEGLRSQVSCLLAEIRNSLFEIPTDVAGRSARTMTLAQSAAAAQAIIRVGFDLGEDPYRPQHSSPLGKKLIRDVVDILEQIKDGRKGTVGLYNTLPRMDRRWLGIGRLAKKAFARRIEASNPTRRGRPPKVGPESKGPVGYLADLVMLMPEGARPFGLEGDRKTVVDEIENASRADRK